MDRRVFVRTTLAASAAMTLMSASYINSKNRKLGLILYTVRGEMSKDPLHTLDRVAAIGYNWLEAADYSGGKFYGMSPVKFQKAVEDRGMELISSHIGMNADNIDEVVGSASEAGLKYLILPSLPGEWDKSLDGFRRAADFMNVAGEKCKSNGIKFGFHNHKNEFFPIDGEVPYDILLNNTDPDLVTFQLDIAWITGGGRKPGEYFNKYPGRFELWHIKDLSAEGQDATLGEGTIDFKPIFELEELAGMKYFFIEQDMCRTHSEFESIDISRDFLLENIFV